jgi:hypothetical protein
VFATTNHVKIGYLTKDTLQKWERDKLDAAKTA